MILTLKSGAIHASMVVLALRAVLKAHTQTASDYRTLQNLYNMIGLYALACSKQHSGSPPRALKNQRTALQYGIFLLPLRTKRNETKRNETKRNRICPKMERNGTARLSETAYKRNINYCFTERNGTILETFF